MQIGELLTSYVNNEILSSPYYGIKLHIPQYEQNDTNREYTQYERLPLYFIQPRIHMPKM